MGRAWATQCSKPALHTLLTYPSLFFYIYQELDILVLIFSNKMNVRNLLVFKYPTNISINSRLPGHYLLLISPILSKIFKAKILFSFINYTWNSFFVSKLSKVLFLSLNFTNVSCFVLLLTHLIVNPTCLNEVLTCYLFNIIKSNMNCCFLLLKNNTHDTKSLVYSFFVLKYQSPSISPNPPSSDLQKSPVFTIFPLLFSSPARFF